MPVSAAPKGLAATLRTRRGAAIVAVLALAAALSIAGFSNGRLAETIGDGVHQSVSGIKTVAAMLAERSPGQRPEGALASLKPKRQTAIHERALPKIRGPVPPASPFAALVGTPPIPPVTPLTIAPPLLYNMVAGPPVVVPPGAIVPGGPGGTTPGGPPVFTDIPPPGGGGVIVPPTTPNTPAVPEPATWAMMLVGFTLMGWALRRERLPALEPSAG